MIIDNIDQPMNEDEIAELLIKTGIRAQPPEALADEVFLNVKGVWQAEVTLRKQSLRQRSYAIAAGFMLMIGAGFMLISSPTDQISGVDQFATVTQAVNILEQRSAGQAWQAYSTASATDSATGSTTLNPLQELRTGSDSYAFVTLDTGFEIRLDANTQVILKSREELDVISGAVYVDSNQLKGGNHLWVNTPFGKTRDIGTQYEVRLLKDSWLVQVREGRVDIAAEGKKWAAQAGERLQIFDNNTVSKTQLKSYDDSWHWTQNVGKGFDLDGQTLDSYLHWLERETGNLTSYQSDEIQADAKVTILHGTIEGLAPFESLSAVLATTNFRLVNSEPGAIVVGK
ncbi:MAG: hypothetical protein ACI8W1_001522 [Candidatus Azotimanducaceae bacterium]|jgi:hypothetical protein